MTKTLFKTRKLFALVLLLSIFNNKAIAQCFQIESILVAACAPPINQTQTQEGYNEMVRFKIGNTNQNVSNLSVNWPSNNWTGLIQNTATANKVAQLNSNITAAGGCGNLVEPIGGVLPAGSTVILVTSHLFDVASNSFGALNETYVILFQNNPSTTTGHFANYNTAAGLRTLSISFGSCSDSVTYDRTQLSPEIGATVNFTASGTPSYVNYGCSAPIAPFTVDAGSNPAAVCSGNSVTLSGSAQGQTSVSWSASSGTFSNPNSLNTNYIAASGFTGTVIATLTATNVCGSTITDTVIITVNNSIVPNFDVTPKTFCVGSATIPLLNPTSPNGITGTWSPSIINPNTSGNYIFTPHSGQCAESVSLSITITNSIEPNFETNNLTICQDQTVPSLLNTAPNGVTGTWNPSVINNTSSGNYIFTPNAGQCATTFTLTVNITNNQTPNFDLTTQTFCSGSNTPTLATTSPNGITGTWNPATINNQNSATYTFTPNASQCANSVSFDVIITDSIVPDFDTTPIIICNNDNTPLLETTSPNGISGTWSPSEIDNQNDGIYIFTPNENQCAESVTLNVLVNTISFSIKNKCDNGNFILFTESQEININDASVDWIDSNGNIISQNDASINVTDYVKSQNTITFPFDVYAVVSINGCESTQKHTVEGIFCNIQKGISPNGDGKNDYFDLSGLQVNSLKIFNRYGTEVYSKKGYTKEWGGQSNNGNNLPDGTYFYTIERTGMKTISGYIQINRQR